MSGERDVSGELRQILASLTGDSLPLDAAADTPLLRDGIGLDSLGGTMLLTAVQRRFGVDVADEDLNLDSLATIGTLAAFIAHRVSNLSWPHGQFGSARMCAVIDGTCDGAFEPVRGAFAENFADRGETGAAVCITVCDRVVADLWGGWTSTARGTLRRADTLVNVFSVGKGLIALLAARLAGDGRLDTDTGR